jgi:hypothetical protein
LDEYSDEEWDSCFITILELGRSLKKATIIVEETRDRAAGEKGYLIRGLEKMIYPDHAYNNRHQAYVAVLREGVFDPEDTYIELHQLISHECLCEALWLAEQDAEFAKKYQADKRSKVGDSSNHRRSRSVSPTRLTNRPQSAQ